MASLYISLRQCTKHTRISKRHRAAASQWLNNKCREWAPKRRQVAADAPSSRCTYRRPATRRRRCTPFVCTTYMHLWAHIISRTCRKMFTVSPVAFCFRRDDIVGVGPRFFRSPRSAFRRACTNLHAAMRRRYPQFVAVFVTDFRRKKGGGAWNLTVRSDTM